MLAAWWWGNNCAKDTAAMSGDITRETNDKSFVKVNQDGEYENQ